MRPIACPNCTTQMDKLSLASKVGGSVAAPIEIDACWPCHLLWFDTGESNALAPQGLLDLFKVIHTKQNDARTTVKLALNCVVCSDKLNLVNDLLKHGRFSYLRCAAGHGRITSVAQFLIEKNFVRQLSLNEIKTLAATVRQIKCSSCGAPVDLQQATGCGHCGAPIAVLDSAAVEKTLRELGEQVSRRLPPAALAGATAKSTPAKAPDNSWDAGDLVGLGIAAILAIFN